MKTNINKSSNFLNRSVKNNAAEFESTHVIVYHAIYIAYVILRIIKYLSPKLLKKI